MSLSLTFFGFLGFNKQDWKEGVQTIGVRVNVKAPDLKVDYARSKGLGLARVSKKALEKDQNTSDRLELALLDFSFPQLIFDEIKSMVEKYSHFKVVQEKDFEATPPDFIFEVDVLHYGLAKKGLDPLPRALFIWKVFGKRFTENKAMWSFSHDKLSAGKNLRKLFSNKAQVLKGEFRAHIMFCVQDLLYDTGIRDREWGLPKDKGKR